VKIVLLNAGSEVGTIVASTPSGASGTGSYTWPIGSTGMTGGSFQVSVQSISTPSIKDASNGYFTITPAAPSGATIRVTSPDVAGITWKRGTTHTITWSYSGDIGPSVKIALLKSGVEIGTVIASTPAGASGTGSYDWVMGSGQTGTDFKVSVQSTGTPAIKDAGDNYFTITL
jgi:hypothetical protein